MTDQASGTKDPGRELHGSDATAAIERAFPRAVALTRAQRELEAAARSTLLRNIGTPGEAIGGHVYVRVRIEDIDALHEALEQLQKARSL